MTKPKAKPKAKPSVEKAEPKKPTVPLKEWDSASDYPLDAIEVDDEVESKYHGKGIVKNFIGGTHPIQIDFGGRLLTYSRNGKYFDDDSAFADKKPAIKIINKKPIDKM